MTRAIVTACVAATALATAGAARGSCIPMTEAQRFAEADVIFDGVALEGATPTGVQRFQVRRYVKGSGAAGDVLPVSTGVTRHADGTGSLTSLSIEVAAGEAWRIYANGSPDDEALNTSVCAGSRRIAAATAAPPHAGDQRAGVARPVVGAALGLAAVAAVLGAGVLTVRGRRRLAARNV